MTTPPNPQLNDAELELLSAYIDNQLDASERGVLEQRLGSDPALRAALDELRGTVALLHELAPLPPPRSFGLDPAAFAPRPSPLFGWLRLGATLASVLLAITFAVEFASVGLRSASAPTASSGAAPAAAAPTAAVAESQRSALIVTEAPAAAGGAAAAAPTAAPAAAAPAAEAQPEATAAPAAAEAPPEATASTKAAGATAAPAAPEPPSAAFAQPTPSAEATVLALESADTSAPATPTAVPTLGLAQGRGYNAPPAQAPAAGYTVPPTSAPVAASSNQSPNTGQLDSSAPRQTGGSPPQPAIRPIRLIQISLAGLALLLGLGALWVRRRGR